MNSRLVFALVLGTALSTHAADFKISGHTFTVPNGFEIELVAAAPLIDRPVSITFDEKGRLYVTDVSGTNENLDKQLVDLPHRVVRLDPADSTGHFKTGSVFADKLTLPEGALWLRGSLYLSGVPSIWKLTPNDPDGAASQRSEWFQGKTLTHCGNDLHGPYAGPDGWLYWGKGGFAEQTLTLGNGRAFTSRASHIYRSRLDGSGLEPVLTGGMDNPVGVTFSPEGERFLSGTFFQNPANGRRDGLIHAIYGGVYGKENDVTDGHPRTGDLLPIMTHLGPAAACGLTRYSSTAFGHEYQNNLFVTCFNLHKVTRHVLIPEGATYRTQDSDFLTCDNPDFHPTDVVEDADGTLLVVDTGGWYKLCCPTSQLYKPDVLGAIYRIRRQDAPLVVDPRGLELDWSKMRAAEAVLLLADSRPAIVARAISRLVDLAEEAIPTLAQSLKISPADGRRNAVWALTQIDAPTARVAVRIALDDSDESVRHAAANSASLWRDTGAKDRLLAMLDDKSPALQRIAAEALGRIGDKGATQALLAQAAKEHDRILDHSLTYALLKLADREGTLPALKATNPRTQRAALFALDQMEGSTLQFEQVTQFLETQNPELRQAGWLVASHHTEWSPRLAELALRRLSDGKLTDAERSESTRMLARFATNASVQSMLADILKDESQPKAMRMAALRAMSRASMKTTPAAWLDGLSLLLSKGDPELLSEAITTLRAFTIPKDRTAEFTSSLARIGRKVTLPAEIRLSALAALPSKLGSLEPELAAFLSNQLAAQQPPLTRAAAAAAFTKGELTKGQLLDLCAALKTAAPMEINRLLPAFESTPDEGVGQQMLAALDLNKGLEGVRADLVKTTFDKFPTTVRQQADHLLSRLGVDPAKQKAHLDELVEALKGGDVRRGQAVFNSQKASCTLCHAIGYLGGNFGPDLTSVGPVRSERDLIEAIVYPSASFVRSYEPFVVVTKSGAEQTGLLRKDAPDEIILATAPGNEVHIPRSEVTELRPGTVSMMPQGFEQILTKDELRDLIAFLKGTKW